ncbi:Bug family tripartite tricarboxylate transporter substrate binding protein [Reyranella sp.]|uniref:Bug family tripartite tricarboxylate transporter substrate binding protein n=1 Tax=Reyranella sp. TaxID=1929291 RepID=UPI003BA98998
MTVYRRTFVGSLAFVMAGAGGARAQAPGQPVKVVVPFPPGGGTDALARAIQDPLQKALGQTVIVENKGGAGGALAHEYVSKQPSDGGTVLVSSNNQMLFPYLVARLGFDPAAFVPVGFVAKQESVFVGSADAPWADLAAITEAARKAPGEVQFGTAGVSTPMHLSTERYAILNKIKLTHVPFRGTGPLVTDLLGGHVKLGMSSLTSVLPHLQSGKLKAYGMAAPERAPSAPDIRTFKEQGFGEVDGTIVYTLIAPPGTPAPVVAKLNEALNASVSTPEMKEELRKRGFVAMGGTPQALADWTAVQAGVWGPVLQAAGIKPE